MTNMAVDLSVFQLSLMEAIQYISDSMLRYSSSIVAGLVSSAVLKYGMSVHDPMTYMVMYIPSISLSLFFILYLDGQCTM